MSQSEQCTPGTSHICPLPYFAEVKTEDWRKAATSEPWSPGPKVKLHSLIDLSVIYCKNFCSKKGG